MTLGPTFFWSYYNVCFLVCFVSSYVKSFFHIVIIVSSFSILHYCYRTFPSHFTMLLLCLPLHFECCFCGLFLCHIVFVVPSLCKSFVPFKYMLICASYMPLFHVACHCYVWALCVCKGFKYVFIKSTRAYLHKCITWPK
jgi:hypothetical protein